MAEVLQQLDEFWRLVVEVWQQGVLGIDIGRLLLAGLIFVGFLAFRRLFTNLVLDRVEAWIHRRRPEDDSRVVGALHDPVRFIPVVIGAFFTFQYLNLPGTFGAMADQLVRSLIVFNIFWAFFNVVDPISSRFRRLEQVFTPSLVQWFVKAIKIVVLLIAAATVLEIWGIRIGPIIAGLGLLGVAVALGAQDLFKNLIAGLLVLGEKRFQPGEWIRVEGVVEGTVETIGFRSTLVRRFDRAPVYVPNAQLADSPVTNFTRMTHRRIFWTIGVEYRTTVDQLRRIRDGIEGYLLESPDFAKPPEVAMFVRIDSFNDSSIDIMVYCFTRTTVWGEWLRIKEALAYRIKEIVEDAGTAFAFPSRSLYVETMPVGRPEAFVPPAEAPKVAAARPMAGA
ncbi:MAG: mechanosensitive ion channel family protein [Rhodospirillales bacterium]|nr:MAG: mechanosensitive ion channel family protein [Rhodospirillales bacterium]